MLQAIGIRRYRFSQCCLSLLATALFCPSILSLSPSSNTSSHTTNSCLSSSNQDLDWTYKELANCIQTGQVFQKFDFLKEEEVEELLLEIEQLQDSFQPSGLSNTVQRQQQFGKQDRSIAAVPWWKDSLEGKHVNSASQKIQKLRMKLASLLDRPTMKETENIEHECYYSTSGIGSFLPRHMDERHEEFKGSKGYLLPSRRSLSWLIYLSDPDWELSSHGGALRAYVPRTIHSPTRTERHTVQHEGNLQVGWLHIPSSDSGEKSSLPRAVFLDSWYGTGEALDSSKADSFSSSQPQCRLYCTDPDTNQIVYITKPWFSDVLQGISTPEFIAECAKSDAKDNAAPILFTSPQAAQQFALLENREEWDQGLDPRGLQTQDVAPVRGSLVVFDSVLVPHQVEAVRRGRRVALAGWFHESTQATFAL